MPTLRPFRIVLASPSDLGPERELLETKVIPGLNQSIARAKNVVLELYRWETDSYPGFHPMGAQGIVDGALKITECDLLMAVFWKRFGMPILGRPETGTEHEIATAFAQWSATGKPDLAIYFKQEPFFVTSVRDVEQFLQVTKFRGEFEGAGKYAKGMYGAFLDTKDFEDKSRSLLTNILLKLP